MRGFRRLSIDNLTGYLLCVSNCKVMNLCSSCLTYNGLFYHLPSILTLFQYYIPWCIKTPFYDSCDSLLQALWSLLGTGMFSFTKNGKKNRDGKGKKEDRRSQIEPASKQARERWGGIKKREDSRGQRWMPNQHTREWSGEDRRQWNSKETANKQSKGDMKENWEDSRVFFYKLYKFSRGKRILF